jgi:hypothetical protein
VQPPAKALDACFNRDLLHRADTYAVSALTDADGPEAVDGVMRKAEAQSIEQYGKYVKLT